MRYREDSENPYRNRPGIIPLFGTQALEFIRDLIDRYRGWRERRALRQEIDADIDAAMKNINKKERP